jgi:hypothetical protein
VKCNVQLCFNNSKEKDQVRELLKDLKEVTSSKTGGELTHKALLAYKDILEKRLGVKWKS